MTRDEATRLVRDGGPIGGVYKSYDEALVDSLSALGILKLDEPKSVEDRVCEALNRLLVLDGVSSSQVMLALECAGLRIVEK